MATFTAGQVLTAAEMNALIPPGFLADFAGSSPPTGWLACDGSAVSRSTFALLFSAIGTTWGPGNGSTTFNVPDLRGRTSIGSGTGTASGATSHTLGAAPTSGAGGEETHTLDIAEMPSHNHTASDGTNFYAIGSASVLPPGALYGLDPVTMNNTGGDGPHNIMQPIAVVTKMIKTGN